MARRNRCFLIGFALLGASIAAPGARAFGEEATLTIAALESAGDDVPGVRLPHDPEARRKALEKMDPEAREKLNRNFEKWQKLSPEEKKAMRNRFKEKFDRMREEIDEAVKASGLELDKDAMHRFAKEYQKGRQAIEKELREERKSRIGELIERLKAEFQKENSAAVPE